MGSVFEQFRPYVTNELPTLDPSIITGIIGESPSQYAKTPVLWNAAFRMLGWDAISQPWDLESTQLVGFLAAARKCDGLRGFSVTVPFKTAIVPLLDALDPLAKNIGAVNTVIRQRDGLLVGSNTDAQGALDALTAEFPGQSGSFLETLSGINVVLIGAGGAARAVAFAIATKLGIKGKLRIVNRDHKKATELANAVRHVHGIGDSGEEASLTEWLADADLVVNASSKGQSGWRHTGDGRAFMLEPYSALAPAKPACLESGRPLDCRASRDWFIASGNDIDRSAKIGRLALIALHGSVSCFDLVYSPLETRFLADARYAGHRTMNGKWMNIGQAADGFVRRVCAAEFSLLGFDLETAYRTVFEKMAEVW